MPSTPDTAKAIPCYVTSTFDWRRAFVEGAREARGPNGPFGGQGALRAPWASGFEVFEPGFEVFGLGVEVFEHFFGLGFEVFGPGSEVLQAGEPKVLMRP